MNRHAPESAERMCALRRLLTNELYTGVVVYRGKRYRGEQVPIVGGRQGLDPAARQKGAPA
jgi:hypothetical protein